MWSVEEQLIKVQCLYVVDNRPRLMMAQSTCFVGRYGLWSACKLISRAGSIKLHVGLRYLVTVVCCRLDGVLASQPQAVWSSQQLRLTCMWLSYPANMVNSQSNWDQGMLYDGLLTSSRLLGCLASDWMGSC